MGHSRSTLLRRLPVGVAAVFALSLSVPVAAGAAPGPSADQAAIAQHFAAFQAVLAQATTAAENSPNAVTPQDKADAAYYVRQLAQQNLDRDLLAADPDHPQFLRDPDPFAIPGLDPPNRSGIYNPDNINPVVVIDGAGTYRITAKRGNSIDLNFQAISGIPGDGTNGTPTATLHLNQLAVNPDGSYTIAIGPTPQSGNWLPTVPQTSLVAVRETFDDWTHAVPDQLSIQRLDRPSTPQPAQLGTTALISAIDAATADVAIQAPFWMGEWTALLGQLPANFIVPPAPTQGGLAGQVSVLAKFDLDPDQALVITVAPSDAVYQGLEAADIFGQTLPYATHESSLNAGQAQLGSDGLYHFVVASSDPGVPNWIDTEGYGEGLLFFRWQELPGNLPVSDNPSAQVVPLSSVRSVLPADTPVVSPVQRFLQLAVRDLGVARRIVTSSNQARGFLARDLAEIAVAVGPSNLYSIYQGVDPFP
jgi:hypothetical protein